MKTSMNLGNVSLKDVFKLGTVINGHELPLRPGIMMNDMDLVKDGNIIHIEKDKVYNIYTDIIVAASDIGKINITLNTNPSLVIVGVSFNFAFVAVEEADNSSEPLCRLILIPNTISDILINRGEGLCTVICEYDTENVPVFIEQKISAIMEDFTADVEDEENLFTEAPDFTFDKDEEVFNDMEKEYNEQQEKINKIEEKQGGSVFSGEE